MAFSPKVGNLVIGADCVMRFKGENFYITRLGGPYMMGTTRPAGGRRIQGELWHGDRPEVVECGVPMPEECPHVRMRRVLDGRWGNAVIVKDGDGRRKVVR